MRDSPGMRQTARPEGRRGIAVALVIIGLVMMFIMSLGFLAQKDSSLPIARNAESTFHARSAAQQGMLAALAYARERTRDWHDGTAPAATNGVLLASQVFPAGSDVLLSASVQDLITNSDPTSETEYFEVVASGDASGIVQRERAFLFAPSRFLPLDGYHSVDLAEFVIFARREVVLSGTTMVGWWSRAPLSRLGRKLRIGASGTTPPTPYDPGRLTMGAGVEVENGVFYFNAGPSFATVSSVLNNMSAVPVEANSIGAIPLLEPPQPSSPPSLALGSMEVADNDIVGPITLSIAFDDIMTRAGGTLHLQGPPVGDGQPPLRIDSDDYFILEPTATLLIEGHVVLVVAGAFNMLTDLTYGANIDLRGSALLEIHIGGVFSCDDGYIGEEIQHNLAVSGFDEQYTDVGRIRLYPTPSSTSPWSVLGNSVVKGQIYSPSCDVEIRDGARIFGRVVGRTVTVIDAFVYYDHALDERIGYTSPFAAFRTHAQDADDLREAYVDIGSGADMSAANLQSLSEGSRMRIRAFGREYTPAAPRVTLSGPASIEFSLVEVGVLGTPASMDIYANIP